MPRVLCHLSDGLGMALGDMPVKSANWKPLQHFPVKHLLIYVLPFPKNAPTAPELLATPPGDFDNDRRHVMNLINRLAATPRAKGPDHAFFGAMSNDAWNIQQWKHIDHHLKQFGC